MLTAAVCRKSNRPQQLSCAEEEQIGCPTNNEWCAGYVIVLLRDAINYRSCLNMRVESEQTRLNCENVVSNVIAIRRLIFQNLGFPLIKIFV